MLSLHLLSGDYITIGEDIVVQVFQTGSSFRVAVDAPRSVPIARGELHERANARPECIQRAYRKKPTQKQGFKRSAQAD